MKHLEIHIGKTSAESSVTVDGQNISECIAGVTVQCEVGKATLVTLKASAFKTAPFDLSGQFMEVPRCDRCQHWDHHEGGLNTAPCKRPELSAGIGSSPWTQPDFGCVLFKPTLTGAPNEPA